jgi:hypothetical protein
MRFLVPLLLLLGLAQAQIAFPTANLTTTLKLNPAGSTSAYRRGQVSLENLAGLLYRLRYQGPASDYLAAGEVLAAGLGSPQTAQAFVTFMRSNAASLRSQGPRVVGVAPGYTFTLELGEILSIDLRPEEATEFGNDRNVLGKEGILIREFADFECPYCKQLAQQVLPQLKAQLIDSGQARFSFRHLPLTQIHPRAMSASLGAECAAEQGRFFDFHDALFTRGLEVNQRARDLGLNETQFAQCLTSPATRDRITADQQVAQRLGVQGTPTVYIGPFLLPNPFDLSAYPRYLAMAQARRP